MDIFYGILIHLCMEHFREKQGPKRKALPKLVYSLLNEKQIKQKLREAGMSTQGDRPTLITRHKR